MQGLNFPVTLIANEIGGGPSPIPFTYVAAATANNTSSITIPATAAIGDVAVLIDLAWAGSGSITEVYPSGFTPISADYTTTGDVARGSISYRVLTAGQPGSSITGMAKPAGTSGVTKIMYVFSPSTAISDITVSSLNHTITAADPSAQTITASDYCVMIAAAGGRAGAPAYTTESPSFTLTTTGSYAKASYIIYDGSYSNHTVDISDSGNTNYLTSFIFKAA